MEAFHQLVLIDETACEVFFIRLNKAKPYFPEDINQSWSYSVSCNVQSQQILITTSELYEKQHPVSALPVLTPPSKEWLFSNLATKLVKWTNEIDPELPLHVKKSVISMERYSKVHAYIKTKYATNIIKIWPECTDPQKFVYEDISIAAYLIVLWEEERQRKNLLNKQSFVDLGCGNGLLVHILNSEGV
ncbi:putative tRNA (uracil-O(2)-)-methyltransferase [Apostichopus japonicus]|uniref:tRNA (uracil-O(2)-)-methyltransferase n=1 Tax=Stichopus japonicus TaxID=307972 RepID=A0A2G8KQ31_STIJA|nr:putative tRNA (uracil-O(2)-)-methyltransferase [Apostichopus japonicus]